MNIGRKLYWSFGGILGAVLLLLATNLIAVHREHETKAAAQRSIDMTEATSTAVSYTHLDVYKRQAQRHGRRDKEHRQGLPMNR